ncbi:hypothetical protein [Alkalinema sp. FACHB-956]|uniref:hypothetical protein n=1 Tax=Alkalinema sp. FACHB-956 TaxID=2692768 RepID=UPI001689A573|nr:hypothetical protein [Alkalinema sp. FACHB-956]MBD2328235.1 hypothetical protein [Alkalinema sp. FACHB-956]
MGEKLYDRSQLPLFLLSRTGFWVNEPVTFLMGISRKGYWRLSKTLATQTGMTHEWLEETGIALN